MKRLVAVALVTLLVAALAGVAAAQDKPKAAAATAPPSGPPPPPPEVKKTVDAFVGTWTFEGTVTGIPGMKEPLKVKESMTCRKAAAGRVAACTGKGSSAMGPYDDENLVAYDANGKAVHFVGMDSMGTVHDHKCSWKDEKTLACEPLAWTGDDGQPATVDLAVTWPDPKTITVVETTTAKDGSKVTFEGKAKRR